MSLKDRIDWVLASGRTLISGVPVNQSRWGLDAGLSRQQVENTLRRMDRDPKADIMVGTLVALADAARVARSWLVLGEGTPDRSVFDEAAEIARAYGVTADEILRVRRATVGERTALEWAKLFAEAHRTPVRDPRPRPKHQRRDPPSSPRRRTA